MKMKEFGPPGGRASLAPPLDPPMACFPEILKNFSERQIFWSLCLVVFSCFYIEIVYSNFTFSHAQMKNVKFSAKQAHPRDQLVLVVSYLVVELPLLEHRETLV